jgi:hypothetical protein
MLRAQAWSTQMSQNAAGVGRLHLVDLPDGEAVPRRILNIKDDGTMQGVPEHAVLIG